MRNTTKPMTQPASKPVIARAWYFASDSAPDKTYETLQYTTGATSCTCPGWTRRVDSQGQRSCKHTRMVHAGMANSIAKKFIDYGTKIAQPIVDAAQSLNLGNRKFSFD